jgi:hypothetical protein
MRGRLAAVALATALGMFVAVGDAFAEGGKTIAGAPLVAFGQQEFGNTANGGEEEAPCVLGKKAYESWWSISVIAGDEVTIDWESPRADWNELKLYEVGATDYTFTQIRPAVSGHVNENGKAQVVFNAHRSGAVPLAFAAYPGCESEVGPYNFTATVLHAVVLFMPRRTHLPPSGTVSVTVHNPEGGPINNPAVQVEVQLRIHGSWHRIGTGSVVNSAASVKYSLPSRYQHQRAAIRAIARGNEYKTASSPAILLKTL